MGLKPSRTASRYIELLHGQSVPASRSERCHVLHTVMPAQVTSGEEKGITHGVWRCKASSAALCLWGTQLCPCWLVVLHPLQQKLQLFRCEWARCTSCSQVHA